jgi:hypothetical protein
MLFTLILSFCMSAPIPIGNVQQAPGRLPAMPQPGELDPMPQAPGRLPAMSQPGALDSMPFAPGQSLRGV